MLATGNQLKAARALIGIEQADLADRANLNVNTIRSMEKAGAGPIAGRAANVQAVQRTLEAVGVEFLNHGQPGVRLTVMGTALIVAVQALNAIAMLADEEEVRRRTDVEMHRFFGTAPSIARGRELLLDAFRRQAPETSMVQLMLKIIA